MIAPLSFRRGAGGEVALRFFDLIPYPLLLSEKGYNATKGHTL
jgi:hypothetical protein